MKPIINTVINPEHIEAALVNMAGKNVCVALNLNSGLVLEVRGILESHPGNEQNNHILWFRVWNDCIGGGINFTVTQVVQIMENAAMQITINKKGKSRCKNSRSFTILLKAQSPELEWEDDEEEDNEHETSQ